MSSKKLSVFGKNHKTVYILLLSVFVAVMPHSRILLSMSEIGLVLLWLIEGNFKIKFQKLKQSPEVILFISIFFIHILGLLHTENFSYAFKDLKIKLPVLILPVIIASSPELRKKDIQKILNIFIISLILKNLYGIFLILRGDIDNPQQLAGSFSHIRYALMLNIAAFSGLYFFLFSSSNKKSKILYLITFIWFGIFIFILHSVTGWVIFAVLIIFSFVKSISEQEKNTVKIISALFFVIIISGFSFYIFRAVTEFYKSDVLIPSELERYTKEGNVYSHNPNSEQKENGHYTNIYICEKELKEAWEKRSRIPYYGRDKKNQPLKQTLIRYLTSEGLRKDKEGVSELSAEDIRNIENGMTNRIFADKFSLYPKIYEILWQAERYKSGETPDNKSILQRLEFLKAGKEIIKRNFWSGVGTGDIKDAYEKQYADMHSRLSEKHRLRSHNQYITIFATFGVFGFLWFVFALIYPVVKTKKYKDYLFMISFLTVILSMFNEDTLETQMGATIFAFFLSFFMFAEKTETEK